MSKAEECTKCPDGACTMCVSFDGSLEEAVEKAELDSDLLLCCFCAAAPYTTWIDGDTPSCEECAREYYRECDEYLQEHYDSPETHEGWRNEDLCWLRGRES